MAKKIPLRQCIGCGAMKGKKEMMRILRTEDGQICLDATGKKNGRGARKNRGLERSFKMSVPDEVYSALEEEFRAMKKEFEKLESE